MTALERRRERARRRERVRRRAVIALIAVGSLLLSAGLPWMLWRGPYVIDAEYLDRAEWAKGSAALVTGLRTAVVAFAAALGAGIALLHTARSYRLTRRGQITDRFTKALERLDSDEIYVRIGGILALEQIVRDAPEQAATDAARVLGHFIRRRAPGAARSQDSDDVAGPDSPDCGGQLPDEPEADVQAALTALTRAESRTHVDPREGLDLHGLHLAGADLAHADLTHANLIGTTLTEVDLCEADLPHVRHLTPEQVVTVETDEYTLLPDHLSWPRAPTVGSPQPAARRRGFGAVACRPESTGNAALPTSTTASLVHRAPHSCTVLPAASRTAQRRPPGIP
ncbi:pentapeptide repeat-containing protein [Streptomyces sp. NPDC127106]|uniref:pentapeptide repeat-containing protein n=1 Tax=Streptomyces sp. NPDC127106 TaxID=3345360 RepID=UPI00362A0122